MNKKSNNSNSKSSQKGTGKKVNARLSKIEKRLDRLASVAVASEASSRSTNTAMNTVKVNNRERIMTVTSANGDFQNFVNKINPGIAESFPWLSNIAKIFDKYRFSRLTYHFKTFVPTSTPGSVSLSYDPDTLDPAPTNSLQVAQQSKWTTNSVWKSFSISINCKGDEFLYTRTDVPTGVDLKTYDLGQLFVSLEGVPAGSVGYVEADYEVILKDKQPNL